MNQLKIPFIIAAVLIGIAMLPMPYGYYMLLRLVLMTISLYAAYLLYTKEKTLWIVLAATAVLYNPLFPIHLGVKALWTLVNIATLVILLISDRMLKTDVD